MTLEDQFRILARERCIILKEMIGIFKRRLSEAEQEYSDLMNLIEGKDIFEEYPEDCSNCRDCGDDPYGHEVCIKNHTLNENPCQDYRPSKKHRRL